HHRQRDAGVARRGLDHRLARFEQTLLLGVVNDRPGQPVLHRGHRVEGLELDVQANPGRREVIDAHDWRVADGGDDGFVDHGAPNVGKWVSGYVGKVGKLPTYPPTHLPTYPP